MPHACPHQHWHSKPEERNTHCIHHNVAQHTHQSASNMMHAGAVVSAALVQIISMWAASVTTPALALPGKMCVQTEQTAPSILQLLRTQRVIYPKRNARTNPRVRAHRPPTAHVPTPFMLRLPHTATRSTSLRSQPARQRQAGLSDQCRHRCASESGATAAQRSRWAAEVVHGRHM
jgi:hypothetical protein